MVWSRSGILLGLVAAFLLAPKISVVSVLRVEDLVFLCALPVLLWRYVPSRTPVPGFMYWYVAYLALALLVSIFNIGHLGAYGVINVARQMQYVIWFFVGAQMALHIPKERFRRILTGVAVVLVIWGIGEASWIIPKIGKFTGASGRVTVNTSGPYEISVILVLLMLIVRNRLVLVSLALVLWLTQSRITLAAALLTYLIFNWRKSVVFGLPVGVFLGGLLMVYPDIVSNSRLAETATPLQMWRAIAAQIETSPLITNLGDYRHYAYDTIWQTVDGTLDISFEIRVIRWALILKSLGNDTIRLLFGWGPGAWGLAVDSHVVRLLGEVGLVGTALMGMFVLRSIMSRSAPRPYRFGMCVVAICAVFIDVLTSSKIMSFLWVILGYYYARDTMDSTAERRMVQIPH
ncbi:hypothetical protein [Pseudophaeobacter sp.]|jgi:hypothetical protein|uniref:hypothetical protein n=1 Tax=Pseudophaeobacter sp. TaxID=1971739 RepID=UPI0025EC2FD1|nr:hypothetical protein [uncultured Pseudophaeobacter sp.]